MKKARKKETEKELRENVDLKKGIYTHNIDQRKRGKREKKTDRKKIKKKEIDRFFVSQTERTYRKVKERPWVCTLSFYEL